MYANIIKVRLVTLQHRPRQFTDVNALFELSDSSHTKEKDEMMEMKNMLKFTEAEHDIGTLSQHFSTAMTLFGRT